jgi:hypothetical protein
MPAPRTVSSVATFDATPKNIRMETLALGARATHVDWVNEAIDPLETAQSDELDEAIHAARSEARADANRMIGMGVGIGAIGVASALVAGAVCPACVVAAPALVGVGLYRRRRARACVE